MYAMGPRGGEKVEEGEKVGISHWMPDETWILQFVLVDKRFHVVCKNYVVVVRIMWGVSVIAKVLRSIY